MYTHSAHTHTHTHTSTYVSWRNSIVSQVIQDGRPSPQPEQGAFWMDSVRSEVCVCVSGVYGYVGTCVTLCGLLMTCLCSQFVLFCSTGCASVLCVCVCVCVVACGVCV